MDGQSIHSIVDGRACQRFGVRIERDRDLTFAKVLGFDTSSTNVRSVARLGSGLGAGELVPLVVLEPYSCDALYTSGQGKVTVSYFNDSPGLIVVDSEASDCSPSRPYSIDSQGTQKGWIRAIPVPVDDIPSAILSYALSGAATANPSGAYDPDDLTDAVGPGDGVNPSDPVVSWYRLYPRPMGASARVTRAPIDWRYNCKTGYPQYLGIEINDCPTSPAPHIDDLVIDYESGAPTGIVNRWTLAGHSCQLQSSDPDIVVQGDWWIDCPGTSGNQGFSVGNSVTFEDGNVVFDGQVRVIGGSLTLNTDDLDQIVAFVREGDFIKDAQATVEMNHTMVYLADGRVDFNGGDGGLRWTAPDETGAASPVVFDDLALWSESDYEHRIGGQAGNDLEGTFFTPYADPFVLSGQGSQFQTNAQFLTRRLELGGQAEVLMSPNPDRVTLIPIREIRLIR